MPFTTLAAVPLHQFQKIPDTKLNGDFPSVFPTTPPNAEPAGSSGSELTRFPSTSWAGGVWDSANRRLLVFAGGHNSSACNVVWAFQLPAVGATPGPNDFKWSRLVDMNSLWPVNNPWPTRGLNYSPAQWQTWANNICPQAFSNPGGSGTVRRVNAITLESGVVLPAGVDIANNQGLTETQKLVGSQYSDGTPVSRHSYGMVAMIDSGPGSRRLWIGPGAMYREPGLSAVHNDMWCVPVTGGIAPTSAWQRLPYIPSGAAELLTPGSIQWSINAASIWDPYNEQVIFGRGNRMGFYKPTSLTSGTFGRANANYGASPVMGITINIWTIDTKRRHLYITQNDGAGAFPTLYRFRLGEADGVSAPGLDGSQRYAMGTRSIETLTVTLDGGPVSTSNKLCSSPAAGLIYDEINDRLLVYGALDTVNTTRWVHQCPLGGGPTPPSTYAFTRITEFDDGEAPGMDTNTNGVNNYGRFCNIGDGLGLLFGRTEDDVAIFRFAEATPTVEPIVLGIRNN